MGDRWAVLGLTQHLEGFPKWPRTRREREWIACTDSLRFYRPWKGFERLDSFGHIRKYREEQRVEVREYCFAGRMEVWFRCLPKR